MASSQLPNYLKANRKRLALSQDDISFLLGTDGAAKVCRYERFARGPSLETALAYEVIFQRSVSELFGGLYRKVEEEVAARAMLLAHKSAKRKNSGHHSDRKRRGLLHIAAQGSVKQAKRS